jgi:2-oxoglutarate dehydrogenase E2 component (dihydrolipoamide succinyltransferase)
MTIEIRVPTLGESVAQATVARWLKHAGDAVALDEPLVELETDKVTVEVNAPAAGRLEAISVDEGGEVEPGAVLGVVADGQAGAAAAPAASTAAASTAAASAAPQAPAAPEAKAGSAAHPPPPASGPVGRPAEPPPASAGAPAPLPAAVKMMTERQVGAAQVGPGSGKDGRITKGDVIDFLSRAPATPAAAAPKPARAPEEGEERVRMTRLRRTIAARLKEAQNTAAMLTTFNEVDMSAAMALRAEYREAFEKKHGGVRLGYMGFFVRACCAALKEFPAVNAEIDAEDIVYRSHVHMGIAVSGASGLVVPVVRFADRMSLAEIERAVADYGKRARDGSLKLEELSGGTFSVTNGGVFGSLMSTPILNPPQSAILGMHKIQDRPVAVGKAVEIRPMMYLALSYDHRVIDGREAVSFLVRVKESIEDPRRLLLEI